LSILSIVSYSPVDYARWLLRGSSLSVSYFEEGQSMRYWVLALLTLLPCGALSAQDHANHAQSRPVTMVSGLGDLHHPVSTSNAEAQKFFDQGLRFIYAFNHD